MSRKINRYSSRITKPKSQGASQAMLYAVGMTEADMQKAQVGISSVWYEGNPCNMHLNELAAGVKESVTGAGLVGFRFNTIGVSDGISMGTEGMSYSLQSRDLIGPEVAAGGIGFFDGERGSEPGGATDRMSRVGGAVVANGDRVGGGQMQGGPQMQMQGPPMGGSQM